MRKFAPWLAAAVIIVIIFGTIYGTVQQSQRNDADMPQIQMAEDTAAQLIKGIPPNTTVAGHVDMAMSLAPFTIVYSKTGKPVAGSGYLENQIPTVPIGVLEAANGKDYHRVTWQPEGDVRIAAVAVSAGDYYVLSGRNMRQIEQNVLRTLQVSAFGTIVSLGILVVAYLYMQMTSLAKIRKKRTATD